MPYNNSSLASPDLQLAFAPSLPRRLLAWVARLGSPECTADPVGMPVSAQAMLQQLLDHHPQARGVFPHLALVEACLNIEGVGGLPELPDGTLTHARAELLSIAGAADVQPLLELFDAACDSPPATPQLASTVAPQVENAASALPRIENLEISEVDEEAYLAVLLEWEESRPMGAGR